MGHDRLDRLAELFWEGACTEAEERELKELVRSGSIPPEHGELKAYFEFTENAEAEDVLGGDFDIQIMQEIDRRESHGGGGGYPMWLKIAAGIVIILGLFGVIKNMNVEPLEVQGSDQIAMVEDTYEDPEMAYEEVKKALALMGMKMNDGMGHAESLGMFDQAREEISNEEGHQSRDKKK